MEVKRMRKPILLLTICLVVAGLLLAACSKQATTPVTSTSKPVTTTTTATTSTTTTTKATTTTAAQTPQIGGTLTIAYGTNIQGWDHAKYPPGYLYQLVYPYDGLVLDDWSKGLAGTGQYDYVQGQQKRVDCTVGQLAESFEMPQQGTIIFHIRHGVHFALDPNNAASVLVGGREVTADDVVFSMKRELSSPTSYLSVSEPLMAHSTNVTKIDNYTVQVMTPPACLDSMWLMLPGREVWAPEVIAKYGDATDWHNTVGTGAFMVQDYVSGSAVTFARNPN
jgi:peptide/nickel transport system substrate-binding protein